MARGAERAHMTIYTIGHSTHELPRLVELREGHAPRRLVDVRTAPRSRHTPQFNAEVLAEELPRADIDSLPSPPRLRRLVVQGWEVCHIGSDGRLTRHELTGFARVGEDGRVRYPAEGGEQLGLGAAR